MVGACCTAFDAGMVFKGFNVDWHSMLLAVMVETAACVHDADAGVLNCFGCSVRAARSVAELEAAHI